MIKLFTNKETIRSNVSIDPVFDFIKRTYKREIDKVTNYYRNSEFTVNNQHILVRVLKTLSVNYNLDIFDYMSIVEDRYPYVANNFNFSSGKKLGKILESEIYGDNSLEAFLSVSTLNDLNQAEQNWEELEPVKVLKHNNKDLGLLLPGDYYEYTLPSLSIFSIDLPMLALQYRSWCLNKVTSDNKSVPINLFIKQYVLPNMIKSQLDYSIINILKDLSDPIIPIKYKHPFPIIDYSSRIHKILLDFNNRTIKKKKRYEDILKNIPSFINDNMYTSLLLPKTVINSQDRWLMLLSRIYVMEYLVQTYPNSVKMNKTVLKDTKIELNMLLRDKTLTKLFKDDILDFIYITIENVLDY